MFDSVEGGSGGGSKAVGGAVVGGLGIGGLFLFKLLLAGGKAAARSSHHQVDDPSEGLSAAAIQQLVEADRAAQTSRPVTRRASLPVNPDAVRKAGTAHGATWRAGDPDLRGTWTQETTDQDLTMRWTLRRSAIVDGVYPVHATLDLLYGGVQQAEVSLTGFESVSSKAQCQLWSSSTVRPKTPEGAAMATLLTPDDLNADPCSPLTKLTADSIVGADWQEHRVPEADALQALKEAADRR